MELKPFYCRVNDDGKTVRPEDRASVITGTIEAKSFCWSSVETVRPVSKCHDTGDLTNPIRTRPLSVHSKHLQSRLWAKVALFFSLPAWRAAGRRSGPAGPLGRRAVRRLPAWGTTRRASTQSRTASAARQTWLVSLLSTVWTRFVLHCEQSFLSLQFPEGLQFSSWIVAFCVGGKLELDSHCAPPARVLGTRSACCASVATTIDSVLRAVPGVGFTVGVRVFSLNDRGFARKMFFCCEGHTRLSRVVWSATWLRFL